MVRTFEKKNVYLIGPEEGPAPFIKPPPISCYYFCGCFPFHNSQQTSFIYRNNICPSLGLTALLFSKTFFGISVSPGSCWAQSSRLIFLAIFLFCLLRKMHTIKPPRPNILSYRGKKITANNITIVNNKIAKELEKKCRKGAHFPVNWFSR